LSAAAAYRKDLEAKKGPIGKDDGAWIAVATMLGQIAHARGTERRLILDEAGALVAGLFDESTLSYGCEFDPDRVDRRSPVARVRLLTERIEQQGVIRLADCMLAGLASNLPSASRNAGRVLAQRARIARKSGETDLAAARFERVLGLARRIGDKELKVRAWIGQSALAHVRGNFPEVRRLSQNAVDLAARCGYGRLESAGHQGILVAAAMAGDMSLAMAHGWKAYQLRRGSPSGEHEALTNVGRLLYDSGQPELAKRAYATVLASHPAVQIGAVALGGFALASAVLSDRRAVWWAAEEATRFSERSGFKYEAASTLLDCADALGRLEDEGHASVLRARASTIAQYAGFHELVHLAEVRASASPSKPTPVRYEPPQVLSEELSTLPTLDLPTRLEFAGAGF